MATIRAVLVSKPNKAGKCPVKIKISIKGVVTYKSTGIRVLPEQWVDDEVIGAGHNTAKYNQLIRKMISEIEGSLLNAEISGRAGIDLFRSEKSYLVSDTFQRLVAWSGDRYTPATKSIFRSELQKLNDYAPSVTFNQITPRWLSEYEQHLYSLGLKRNTVFKSFKTLKKVFNHARREGLTNNYPFDKYDCPKWQKVDKEHLTRLEQQCIEDALCTPISEVMRLCGYYFLLGCYSGLRISDWYRFNGKFVQGDRLLLRAKKNGEYVSMKMHSRLKKVVDVLLTMPPAPSEKTLRENITALATLSGITKKITPHSARHTFACTCASIGIPVEETANFMGITIKTCLVYYKITGTKSDSEIEKWDG